MGRLLSNSHGCTQLSGQLRLRLAEGDISELGGPCRDQAWLSGSLVTFLPGHRRVQRERLDVRLTNVRPWMLTLQCLASQ